MNKDVNIRHAIVSTDVVLFSFYEGKLKVAVTNVKNNEYLGQRAFPGTLVLPEETLPQSVSRILLDKMGLKPESIYREELGAYSDLDRDIRGRVVSVAYIACADYEKISSENFDKFEVADVRALKGLAYDHDKILKDAVQRIKDEFSNSTIAQKFLGSTFTMSELYGLYLGVLGKEIDKRNFMKKIKSLDIIEESGGVVSGLKHRPAKLFKFKDRNVKKLEIF